MLINLKISAAMAQLQQAKLTLQDRLPTHINPPCMLNCQFKVTAMASDYLISLQVNADLSITCQRCLQEFLYHYSNQTELAVSRSEERAEKLMDHYEGIVAPNGEVNLAELLTDELHLYTPKYHPQLSDCDEEISRFIGQNEAKEL